ncbi:MAG: ubiquitin family protein [Acidobacteriaceae bacterium]
MSKINVFLQGEGIKDVVRLQLEPHSTGLDVKRACASQFGVQMDGETAVFLEDQEEPLDDTSTLESLAGKHGVRLHVHRCRRITVKVTYSSRTVEHVFGPGVTVGTVKRWAAKNLGITKEDAAELILQIVGTQEQPDVDVHIGTLSMCPACAVAFNLVPNLRIQGAP